MSDFKDIVEFFRLNRRADEAKAKEYEITDVELISIENDEQYLVNKNIFESDFTKYKRIFHLLENSIDKIIYVEENTNTKSYFVKISSSQYRNLINETLESLLQNEIKEIPITFNYDEYIFDTEKNLILIFTNPIKELSLFADTILYDPNSELLKDFDEIENIKYKYKTHKTWIHDFLEFFIPNNDAEEDPFKKQLSDNDVEIIQTKVASKIYIIPYLKEANGKYYVCYKIFVKNEEPKKFTPFYFLNRKFNTGDQYALEIKFNSIGAFMTYLNETIFSQTENLSSDIRQIFLEQYYNLVIVPLLKNLDKKGRFYYEEVIKMLFYLHNSLFYLLPEDFLWSVFEKAIENNSFINKPYLKEEDIFLKIIEVLASKEKNAVRLIERLNKTVSTKNKMSLLEYLYDRIHGENFIKFASIINEAWRKTRFIDPSTETNPEYQSTNGPLFLPYQSEKIASFFFDNITANFEDNPKDKNERILQFNFKTGKTHEVPAANATGQKTEKIIEKYYYHPFYPVKITNTNEESTSEQETSIKLDAIVPAFMLMANTNMQFWKNVIKTGEYTLDAIVIATSYGALSEIVAAEVITTLAVVRGIGATAAITSSVASTILKLANAEDSALVQEFIEYLFWIEMLSLSGEITIAIRKGLKRSARKLVENEEDLAKLEKQLDDAVIEENGKKRKLTQEEKDNILNELEEIAEIAARKQKVKDIYEKGYNYTKVGMPDGRTIQKLFSTKGNKLVAKVEQRFKQFSKLSKTKRTDIVLVNGTTCSKYIDDVILHTNFPDSKLKIFIAQNKIFRGKASLEDIKKIYKFYLQEGHIQFDMHPFIEKRLIKHFEELKKGIKHSSNYDWVRTGGLPGVHAEVLSINEMLWRVDKVMQSKGLVMTEDIFTEMISYNKNLERERVMIRCGDCNFLTYDVPFIEKILTK